MKEEFTLELTGERYKRGLVSVGNKGRISKFWKKLKSKKQIIYGAIGGSITAGAAASALSESYVNLFASWLDQESNSSCHLVNAGIGASNSMFGAFRIQKDLLKYNPDIITIEFAVNDINNPDIASSYEWLIRQCVCQKNNPLIILIFTMLADGSNCQNIHIPIGQHYQVGMLSYRDAIFSDIKSQELEWQTISPDEVHPNNTGHTFIYEMLKHFIVSNTENEISNDLVNSSPNVINWLNHSAKKYEGGKIIDASMMAIQYVLGWKQGPHKGGYIGWQTNKPNALLQIRFKGQLVLVGYQQYTGNFGRAGVSIDNNEEIILEGFYEKPEVQQWAGGHTVLKMLEDKLSDEEHIMKIRTLQEKHPNSEGYNFDIGYLLIN